MPRSKPWRQVRILEYYFQNGRRCAKIDNQESLKVVSCEPEETRYVMLRAYIKAAMRKAQYKLLPDGRTYYGEIPGFQEVHASAKNLRVCRDKLEDAFTIHMIVSLRKHD